MAQNAWNSRPFTSGRAALAGPALLVQSHAVPKPDGSLSAVVVSGGKQYRVAPGDRILVDRLSAEPGSSLKLGRVLLLADGDGVKVGSPAVDGIDVDVKVLAHQRGPRVEGMRYKSKKRVRVHHGGRAHLTAIEIIAVGGVGVEKKEEKAAEKAPAKSRGRGKAAPKKAEPRAEAAEPVSTEAETAAEPEQPAEAPKRARRTRKEEK